MIRYAFVLDQTRNKLSNNIWYIETSHPGSNWKRRFICSRVIFALLYLDARIYVMRGRIDKDWHHVKVLYSLQPFSIGALPPSHPLPPTVLPISFSHAFSGIPRYPLEGLSCADNLCTDITKSLKSLTKIEIKREISHEITDKWDIDYFNN